MVARSGSLDQGKVERDSRILVIGAGREGMSAARFLAATGAYVTLTDRKSHILRDYPGDSSGRITESPEVINALDSIEAVVVSPGVPDSNPLLAEAMRRGLPITNATQIFFQRCPCPIVGVTGSSGKSTTTALIASILREDGRDVALGGNIGNPMLDLLEDLHLHSIAVLELSSFQLQFLDVSPHLAVVTNVTPNHLDRHRDFAAYLAAKTNILSNAKATDIAVLNRDDPIVREMRRRTKANVLWFGLEHDEGLNGYVKDGAISVTLEGHQRQIIDTGSLPLPGQHNLANALAATCAAAALGVETDSIAAALSTFHGLPHRLERVAVVDEVLYVDDSIATSPERAAVGLDSTATPVVLIAGGRSKHLPWLPMLKAIDGKAHTVVLVGEAAGDLQEAIEGFEWHHPVASVRAPSFAEAVTLGRSKAQKGDTTLLSPGCTSYDMFSDYEERGNAFKSAVEEFTTWQP